MSAIWRKWTSGGSWWASAWFTATEKFGGPFTTEADADAWIEKERKKYRRNR